MRSTAYIHHLLRLMIGHARWLARPRLVWACGLVITCALLLVLLVFPTEFGVRVTGLGLELLGLALTLRGLVHTRRFFGQPSLKGLFLVWASGRPKRDTGAAHTASSVSSIHLGGSFPGIGWTTVNPSDSIENQIKALTENVLRQQRDIGKTQSELAALSYRITEGLEKESAARSVISANFEEKLERSLTDGIYEALVGLVWLLCGTILSTMSLEISRL